MYASANESLPTTIISFQSYKLSTSSSSSSIAKDQQLPHSNQHQKLKCIHKLRILPIRQIQPLLVVQLHILRLRSQQHLLGILPPAVPVDEQHVDEAHGPARDNGDLGGDVAGRVAGAESLGADDVADAVGRGWGLVGLFWGFGIVVVWAWVGEGMRRTNTQSSTTPRRSSSSYTPPHYC